MPEPAASLPGPPLLVARDIWKSFPGVQALAAVDLEVHPGSVHALVGENGAGKSTLMNIVGGLLSPDRGELLFQSRPARFRNPHQALRAGISMIHQELLPFPNLSVAENILIGREPASRGWGWLDRRRLQTEAQQLVSLLDVALPLTAPMAQLSVAQMQLVEIARALGRQSELLIMDEPTAALSEHEVERLFRIMHDLRRRGVAVLYISHRLEEIFRMADRVTVLRDGRRMATAPTRDFDRERLIQLMVGRPASPTRSAPRLTPTDAPVLRTRQLSRRGAFANVSMELRPGEIVGLAGLVGAGRTELAHALFGLTPPHQGEVLLNDQVVRIRRPADALRHGIALVSEDRRRWGLVLPLSVQHNLTLASLAQCCRAGFVRPGLESEVANREIARRSIRPPDRHRSVRLLSGGNQQKVVLAKALLTRPRVLLLDEPTRGVDVAAKSEIHETIRELSRQGLAILLISSDMPELLALSDRILVMREGRLVGGLSAASATPADILHLAMPTATAPAL